MKIGQWLRQEHRIGKIINFKDDGYITLENECWYCRMATHPHQAITKADEQFIVSSCPQELIQVGDLVKERHGYIGEVATKHEAFINTDSETIFLNHIVIIYTKDSNGNYIKQWDSDK